MNLTDEERTVLDALADADEPTTLRDLMVRIDPSQSAETWSANVQAWGALRTAGWIGAISRAAGEVRLSPAGRYVLTDAGHQMLTAQVPA